MQSAQQGLYWGWKWVEKFKNYICYFKRKYQKKSLEDFININASGKIAMKLSDDDKIIGVKICKEDQDILLSTKFGKCIRFMSKNWDYLKDDHLKVSENAADWRWNNFPIHSWQQ